MSKPTRWRLAALAALVVVCVGAGLTYGWRSWIATHRAAAEAALTRRDFRLASMHLRKCLQFTTDPQLRLLSAQTARRGGDFSNAERLLQGCERDFGATDSVNLERRLLLIQQGELNDADRTLSYYTQHPELADASTVLEAYIVGQLKLLKVAYTQNAIFTGSGHTQQLERTREAIKQWLELRPEQADQVQGLVWRFQALAYGHAQAQAWADIRRAVELDPNHREARLHLSNYLAQESPVEAATHLHCLHESDPQDTEVSLVLANVLRQLGQLDESQELLAQILANDPENVSALMERGRVALDLQQLAQAEHWFRCVYRVDPNSPQACLALSQCLRATGKVADADFFQDKFDRLEAIANQWREAASHPQEQP